MLNYREEKFDGELNICMVLKDLCIEFYSLQAHKVVTI
jgi:hypothetical protein